MNIVMLNRPRHSWTGGDIVQMDATINALRDLGHTVEYLESFNEKRLNEADVIHLWNFHADWTYQQYQICQRLGLRTVCSTIYTDSDKFTPYSMQKMMAHGFDALIFLCEGEKERFEKRLGKYEHSFIVPNGIEDWFFEPQEKGADYVLTVGRLDESKGQMAVAKACAELGKKYLCIGDGDYLREVTIHGAEVIQRVVREELPRYYAKAECYILASETEVFPLSVLEAAAQDVPIILTENSCWQPEGVTSVKFNDVDSIKAALRQGGGRIDVSPYSWDKVAKELERIYDLVA